MRKRSIDVISAITLALLAIVAFVVQYAMLDDKTTQRETILFNVTQFILTVGFTWFAARAISASEYEQSLKRFAIGAYRRILDIDNILNRLKSMISRTLINRSRCENCAELQIVTAVIDDAKQMTKSSILDWSDIIGEELLKIQNIKQLEDERKYAFAENIDDEFGKNLSEKQKLIDEKLNELLSSLPLNMRVMAEANKRSKGLAEHAARWFHDLHKKDDGLILKVATGLKYGDYDKCELLDKNEKVRVIIDDKGKGDIANDRGDALGRVLNNSPLDYYTFTSSLSRLYGSDDIKAEFLGIQEKRETEDGMMAWYTVRVLASPVTPKLPKLRHKELESQPVRSVDSQ